jgi:type IV secretion system protein VirB5
MNILQFGKAKIFTALGGSLLLTFASTSAFAIGGLGDIVYDPSNYLQAVKQVQAWEQQYAQMTQSLQKAQATLTQVKAQVDAVTGVRGFGDLLNNPVLKQLIPSDLSHTLAGLNATGALSGNAAVLRSATMIYDCGDLSNPQQKTSCQAILAQNAQAQSVQQQTLALLNDRTTQIDALRAQINSTQDPKAIAELQARLAAEEAQVGNDQNKIAIANAMLETNRAAAVQAQRERVSALVATNKPSALDGFSFTALAPVQSHQEVAAVQ